MNYSLYILTVVALICSCNLENRGLSDHDKNDVLALNEKYRINWLKNDSTSVVDLFTDDAALIPPNNAGDIIHGKNNIGNYWFPEKDTTYVITAFEMTNQSVTGGGAIAVLEGESKVDWNTVSK